jgi:hypothetical protein
MAEGTFSDITVIGNNASPCDSYRTSDRASLASAKLRCSNRNFRGSIEPAHEQFVGVWFTCWRYWTASIRILNTARNRSPGPTSRSPRPVVRALVGAVIGSSAI